MMLNADSNLFGRESPSITKVVGTSQASTLPQDFTTHCQCLEKDLLIRDVVGCWHQSRLHENAEVFEHTIPRALRT